MKSEKITIGQFLSFTNHYVPVYIEDEFQRYDGVDMNYPGHLLKTLGEKKLACPIDYFRNVDGGHFGDDKKVRKDSIVLGIGIENWEKYFGKK